MTRTNIDIDDELIHEVMRQFAVPSKREAVDLALRRMAGLPLTRDFLAGLEGIGWEGDLGSMRATKAEPDSTPRS